MMTNLGNITVNLDKTQLRRLRTIVDEMVMTAKLQASETALFWCETVGNTTCGELRLFGFRFLYTRAGRVRDFKIIRPHPIKAIRQALRWAEHAKEST